MVALSACCVSPRVAAAVPSGPSWRTPCAEIDGQPVALSPRWRVLWVTSTWAESDTQLLIACDPRRHGPAQVVVIAQPADGDVTFDRLSGDLVTLHELTGSSGGHLFPGGSYFDEDTTTRLVDVRRPSRRGIEDDGYHASGSAVSAHTAMSALLPSGAMLSVGWPTSPFDRGGGEVRILDALGDRTGPAVMNLAGTHGGRSVAYAVPAGKPEQIITVPTHGRVQPEALKPSKAGFHVLRTHRRVVPKGERWTELPATGPVPVVAHVAHGPDRLGDGVNLGARGPWIKLASGSGDEVRVLDTAGDAMLVVARFADRPRERRLRLLHSGAVAFDLPPRDGMLDPGNAITFGGNGVAISDGTGKLLVRVPGAARPEVFDVRARHLAVLGVAGGYRIAYLERDGRPASVLVRSPPNP